MLWYLQWKNPLLSFIPFLLFSGGIKSCCMGTYSTNDGLQHLKCGSLENFAILQLDFKLWRWKGDFRLNDSLKSYNGTEGLNVWKPNIMLVYPCGSSVYNIFFEGFTCIPSVMSMRIHVMFWSTVWPSLTTLNQHMYHESTNNLAQHSHNLCNFLANQFDTWNWWINLLFKRMHIKKTNMLEGFSEVLLLMVQKSHSQPPGMLIKPCN